MSSILLPGPADISDSLHTGSRNHGREKRRAIEANTSSDKASSKSGSKQLENRKLRASCDSCYLAKIKCGKERPKCTRCVTHGTPCLYSPSQRIGKPRRNPPTVSTSSPRQHRPNISIARQLTPLSQQRDDHDSASLDERHGSPSNDKAVNTSMLEWPFHLTPPNSDTSGETSVPLTPGLSLAWQQALHGPSPQPRLDAFTDGDVSCLISVPSKRLKCRTSRPAPSTYNIRGPNSLRFNRHQLKFCFLTIPNPLRRPPLLPPSPQARRLPNDQLLPPAPSLILRNLRVSPRRQHSSHLPRPLAPHHPRPNHATKQPLSSPTPSTPHHRRPNRPTKRPLSSTPSAS